MQYVIIPHIRVQRANAQATPWAISPAPVFACNMLAHALGCDIGSQPCGLGIIHHDAQFLAEHFTSSQAYGYYPQQFRGATYIDRSDYSSKNKHALALQPTASMHIELSLVLAYADNMPLPSACQIKKALARRRLAGGLILGHENISLVENFWGDQGVLSHLRQGFWLLDRSEELTSTDSGRTEALLQLINDRFLKQEKPHFLTAATLGYATLTAFARRQQVRKNKLHAFAEPLVGLVEYKSTRHITEEDPVLWHEQWLQDDVFIVKSHALSTFQQGAFS